ncbi:MAG: hypothetical protein ACI4PQ_01540 [Butyricicoccaceae bacterium]
MNLQLSDLEELHDALQQFLLFLRKYSRRSPHFYRYIEQMYKATDRCLNHDGRGLEDLNRHLLHDWKAANHAQTGIPSWVIWHDDPQKRMQLNAQYQEKVMSLERFFS